MSKVPDAAELFEAFEPHARAVLANVPGIGDVDAILDDARARFLRLAPEMPYADRRDHIMWEPTLMVHEWLAVHLACRERGIDAHALGAALLQTGIPPGSGSDVEVTAEFSARALRDAAASLESAAENEFVFEILPGDERTDYGIDITRCAVCHAFAKHDATAFTPYMCATDDLVSDRLGQGLRRTGTIGLGAHRCDFRYKAGGEPLRLADQYPEKIRTA